MEIKVECYSGYRGEETPRRFRLGEQWCDILSVKDRWLAPEHRYFKVVALDGEYILRHDDAVGCWELVFFLAA